MGLKHRARGEGCVFFDARANRWKAVSPWPHRLTRSGKTQREAIDRLKDAVTQRGAMPVRKSRQTWAEFRAAWLQTRKLSVRPRTYIRDEGLLGHTSALDRMPLPKINGQAIQEVLNASAKIHKPATVQLLRTLLKQAFSTALLWHYVGSNPVNGAVVPKIGQGHVTSLETDERKALRDKVRGTDDEALFDLYILVGPRRGEALALAWSDMDLENGTATIRGTLQRHDHELHIGETKTRAGERTIPLPASLVASLKRWRTRQLELKLKAGRRWEDSGLVFTTRWGTPIEPRNVLRKLDALMPGVTVHMLRHTAATFMIRGGVEITEVARILGHASPAITLRVYAHVIRDMSDRSREKLNAIAES